MKALKPFIFIALCFLVASSCTKPTKEVDPQLPPPNILWIVSEDNGPFLGCYGDKLAITPHIDKLASQGVLYQNAFANVPVCAPARFTLITGMYASSLGTMHMRSRYPVPDFVKTYTHYLKKAGYYCTNKTKNDFNFKFDDSSAWHDNTENAHYKNRKPGQPFFAIFNLFRSHESSLHRRLKTLKHDPEEMKLPPYHPDTPEIRRDWAQYYTQITEMDRHVGKVLDELDKSGLADDTIVFYFSDHGGVLARSKRYLYDSGVHVPLIVRFPEKYKHLAPSQVGSRTDRLVSFVDFAPTLLSLCDIDIPQHMQGTAFLGKQKTKERDYVHLFRSRMDERYDMMRASRDKRFKYIRNYMPHKIYGQYLSYLWRAPNAGSWEKAYKEGRCNKAQSFFWNTKPTEELYDIVNDPWEVNNLADNPKYKKDLERLRKTTRDWVIDLKDPGFLPEGQMIDRSRGSTPYELCHQKNFPYEDIVKAAEVASNKNHLDIPALVKQLTHKDSAIRFWGAQGCVIAKEQCQPAKAALLEALQDTSADVRIAAAHALYYCGEKKKCFDLLKKELQNPNYKAGLHAANVVHLLRKDVLKYIPDFNNIKPPAGSDKYNRRIMSHTQSLLK